MRTFFTPIFLIYGALVLNAQAKYPAFAIPDSLLKDADYVVRLHELRFEVLNKGLAIETEHKVVTLLNDRASELGEPSFDYYEFKEIEDIEASVYDAAGNLVRNLKKKDISDVKPPEHGVDDFRLKVLKLPARAYPYTIEYTVTTRYKGLMFYPMFIPQSTTSCAVESANFELVMPAGLEARTKELNVPAAAKAGPLHWAFRNLRAARTEPFAPVNDMYVPVVLTAPTDFSFGGVDGDMRTWESYGTYMEKLLKTQQELPAELKAKLQVLVADCPDAACKIRRVYDYLQSNTRYFYVGYGIGGWQPAPALKVDQYKYGDCKGLSNYTAAMLNAVGVTAYYSVVRAGSSGWHLAFADFPNPQFNHVIVCAPMERDTFWLECTSQAISCGFLGDFTDNRPAMVVTPAGGKLVRTPKYDERHNTTLRQTLISLQRNGSATLQSKNVYTGILSEEAAYLEGQPDETRKQHLYKWLSIRDFEIKSLAFVLKKDKLPSVEQTVELLLPTYASVNGMRLFIPLSPLSARVEPPIAEGSRKADVQPHRRGITEEDVLTIALPPGSQLESVYEPMKLETPFGSYESSIRQEGDQLLVYRKYVLNSQVQPRESYADFVAFQKAVSKADKRKLVVVLADRP